MNNFLGEISKKKKNKFLNFTVSILLSVVLLYFALKKVDFRELYKELQNVRIIYILLALFIYYFTLIARAEKWKIQVENLDYKISHSIAFLAIVYHYFFNSFTVKLGAVARCAVLKKEKVSISECIGTCFSEMIYDFIFLIAATILMFIVEYKKVIPIFSGLKSNIDAYLTQRWKIILIISFSLIFLSFLSYFIIKKYLKNKKTSTWFIDEIKSFNIALKSTFRLKKFFLFLVWNFVLWILLFYMNFYLAKAVNISYTNFGLILAITVFTYYAWLLPTPGGIGSVEYFVLQSFLLFALSRHSAVVYGLLSNSLTLFGILLLGIIGFIFIKNKFTLKPK